MSELIERLEKATGPDRELDQAIVIEAPVTKAFLQDDGQGGFEVLHYTASIDAALTLLPPEFWGSIQWAGTLKQNDRAWPVVEVGSGDQKIKVQAATIPLSVCLAALRARAAIAG